MSRRRQLALLPILALLPCLPLAGEDAPLDTSPQALAKLFADHDYVHAEAVLRQLIAANPKDPNNAYNLACVLARQGHTADALSSLADAEKFGFSDADHTQSDDDLASLHNEAKFQQVVAAMRTHPFESDAPLEPLATVPGARVVDRSPEGGLHYRLYIGEQASAKDRARLMVWLHPSGGSADQLVLARLAPDLIQHGWALMIFPQKQYQGWSGDEFGRIQPCIADVEKNEPDLDPLRPVPLTFSAGGQAALEIWHQVPQFWSALVLDAAYPIDTSTMQARPLTPAQAACKTPILAIVGSKDGGCALWEKMSPEWTAAGVPVQVLRVEGHGHEFLYYQGVWTATLKWLDALKASQKGKPSPGTTADGKDATKLAAGGQAPPAGKPPAGGDGPMVP